LDGGKYALYVTVPFCATKTELELLRDE